jgi:hypothetical protein
MTSTRPLRRMILHFSHIGLTDGLTFTEFVSRREGSKDESLPGLWRPDGRRYLDKGRTQRNAYAQRAFGDGSSPHRSFVAAAPL